MSEKRIGLAEFIERIKLELLTRQPESGEMASPPLFMLDSIDVEMSVGVTKGGEGGFTLYVVEVGGKVEAEHVQKVSVTLSPILDRQTRLKLLDPRLTRAQREQILYATIKSPGGESLKDLA